MGNAITMDKRITYLEDWLEVHNQINTIDLHPSSNNHIAIWKLCVDQNSNQINCLPQTIDFNDIDSFLTKNQVYIILAIRHLTNTNPNGSPTSKQMENIAVFVNSLKQNIEQISYQTMICRKELGKYQYCIYVYLGKNAINKIKIIGLSYAYRLNNTINSEEKLMVLGGGSFIKNKKIQKGFVGIFISNKQKNTQTNKQLSIYSKISIIRFYNNINSLPLSIFSLKPKIALPIVSKSVHSEANINSNSIKPASIKPPMLKLSLKPFEQVTYEQIQQQQNNGVMKFDIRATTRHQLKMQKFQNQCNEIIEGLYVSGEKVAKDIQMLEKYKIKQIINCAGDYCENWHENKGINYLTFFLKDSQNQNIECLFYRVIEFIQNALKNKNNVLIHCIQGISRSVTFVIAYIIFTYGYDYKKAQSFVKQKRPIASPNNGFMVQLIQFHKRLYQDLKGLSMPRVFLVSSHCKQTPNILTARLLKNSLFDIRKCVGLDARGVYIIQTQQLIYLWVGSKCDESHLQKYWTYAQEYIKKLQRYERAPVKIKAISQGSETPQFFQLWNLPQIPPLYQNQDYNKLFHTGQSAKPGGLRKYYQRQEQKVVSTRLFIYPDLDNGLGVFDMEDLNGFCIIVNNEQPKIKVYIWRSNDTNINENEQSQYLENILKNHYPQCTPQSIIISEENVDEYSAGFLGCFS